MSRFTFSYLKPIPSFLIIAVLFQCCVVYDINSVSVEEAIDIDHKKIKRIKMEMLNGKKLVLDSLYFREGVLYGSVIKPKRNLNYDDMYADGYPTTEIIKNEIIIEEDKIKKIFLYDRQKSITYTVVVVVAPILVGGIIFGLLVYLAVQSI